MDDYVALAAAAIALAGAIYTAARSARSEKQSDDWARIQGLWARVDKLEGQNRGHESRIRHLEGQNRSQQGQIDRLRRVVTKLRNYARDLRTLLLTNNITPPDPPPGTLDETDDLDQPFHQPGALAEE
jgi:hypothetical protein